MTAEATEVWSFLTATHRRRRRARGSRLAYVVYVVILAAVVYGGPLILRAVRSVQRTPRHTVTTTHLLLAMPDSLSALTLLVVVALARQAIWRGPVVLDAPDADWLLPLPLSRTTLLRPKFGASLISGAVLALLAGVVGSLVLRSYALGAEGGLLLASVVAAVLICVTGLSAAALVERSQRLSRLTLTWSPLLIGIAVAAFGLGVATAAGVGLGDVGTVVTWSGPWGWSTQLVMHAAGDGASHWPVGAALLAVTCAASLLVARAAVPQIAGRSLRQRAATAGAVGAAVFLGEFRDARLAIRDVGRGPARRRSLRLPVHRSLAVVWRDLSALRRSLGAAAWTLPFLGVLALALHVAVDQRQGRHTIIPIGFALIGGYIAALQLVEPARLDADDPRRTRWSPYPAAALAQRHAVVPTVLLAVVGLVAALVGSPWLGLHHAVLAAAAACVLSPVLVATALVSGYRGRVPLQLMFSGPDIGFGPTGPVLVAAWYLYGPITVLVAGEMTLLPLVGAWRHGSPPTVPVLQAIAIGAGWTAVILWWVGARARRRR
ncbi:MAG TPA: hypothetical protein VHW92_03270 [Mycobacteriales bacterium]|nr:hypothetical protein [Mycobacteriales bacterium]